MNILQTFRHATEEPNPPAPLPRKNLPSSIKMASKTSGECEVSSPESKKAKLESNSTCQLCLFHKIKSHTLNECKKFRELTWEEKRDVFKKNKLCFKSVTPSKHNAEHCDQTPPVCDICHKRHLTAPHTETTPDHRRNLMPQRQKIHLQLARRRKPVGRVPELSVYKHPISLTQLKN